MADYAALHAPHAALLEAALAAATPRGARLAIDLGCGQGSKTPWLAAHAAGALVISLDRDAAALRLAGHGARLCADAHALPLRTGCADLIWCVATLGLLASPAKALAEIRRALRPGGRLVVAVAGERWVRPRRWPSDLVPGDIARCPPADELGAELGAALVGAGLEPAALHAYLLDPPGLAPLEALLPLADLLGQRPLAIEEPEPLPVLLVAVGRAPR